MTHKSVFNTKLYEGTDYICHKPREKSFSFYAKDAFIDGLRSLKIL